jgi:hypothetical protein
LRLDIRFSFVRSDFRFGAQYPLNGFRQRKQGAVFHFPVASQGGQGT